MTAFLIVVAIGLALDLVRRCSLLGNPGQVLPQSRKMMMLDGLFNVCLLGWDIGLLARGV